MLFSEPPPSPYDLHFSLFGTRVRVHPLFWLVSVILGLNAGKMIYVLVWVVAVFLAILVHEFGHALVMRRFGLRPWIVLHGMGGVACYDSGQLSYSRANTWIRQILISLAGAGAGFLLALGIVVVCLASGCTFIMLAGMDTALAVQLGIKTPTVVGIVHDNSITGFHVLLLGIPVATLGVFVNDLLSICVLWGLVNLLPVYPLDGGQISREVFLRFSPREGIHHSLMLSIVTAGGLAAFALMNMLRGMQAAREMGESIGSPFQSVSFYIAIFFGYMAYSSYATLQAYGIGRPRW
ncbi:MAG: hypothetical protein JW888_09315 [Pirellulales bacterium]|nr:hypothetical protein [Pirellulales bacterium]